MKWLLMTLLMLTFVTNVKRCIDCGEWKALDAFHRIHEGRYVRPRCKACHAAYVREYRARKAAEGAPPVKACQTCGVALDRHWRCAGCGALGHAIPRGSGRYCRWCEKDQKKGRKVRWGWVRT